MTINRWLAVFAVFVLLLVIALWTYNRENDGIEEGKEYALAYSLPSNIKLENGVTIQGRTFDFADRNLPRTSIVVPLKDERGPLVWEDTNLTPGTARKSRFYVQEQEIEGITYPGYWVVIWRFNFNHKTNQVHVPTVTPKK